MQPAPPPTARTGAHRHATQPSAQPPTLEAHTDVAVPVLPHAPMRELLHARFRGRSTPVLAGDGWATPAASIWAGTRLWVKRFRSLGLRAGDRVVIASPPGPGLLMPLLACWWGGLAAALTDPPADADSLPVRLLESLDARLLIAPGARGPHVIGHDRAGCPLDIAPANDARARPATFRETDHADPIALLMRTSGTTAPSRWIALSHTNVLANLHTHAEAMGLSGATVLSVLPWSHAFGLLIDALPALLRGATVVVDPPSARDPHRALRTIADNGVTHLSMVPLQARRLLETAGGEATLRALRGGIIGGAPVDARAASALNATALRVGYGQTEASPGITLGEPGVFAPALLGRPIGCDTRLDETGRLLVRGPNVCAGYAHDAGITRLAPGRWLDTGDLAEETGLGYRFIGRVDASFKLPNGRMVHAARAESTLRSTLPPGIEPVILPQNDGICLVLLGGSTAQTPGAIRALGALGRAVRHVDLRPDHSDLRTPKGEVDRRAIKRLIDAGEAR